MAKCLVLGMRRRDGMGALWCDGSLRQRDSLQVEVVSQQVYFLYVFFERAHSIVNLSDCGMNYMLNSFVVFSYCNCTLGVNPVGPPDPLHNILQSTLCVLLLVNCSKCWNVIIF